MSTNDPRLDPMMIAINDAIMEGFEELNPSQRSNSPRSFDPEHQRCDHMYAYEELLPPKCREKKESTSCSSEVNRLLYNNLMPSCSNLNNEGYCYAQDVPTEKKVIDISACSSYCEGFEEKFNKSSSIMCDNNCVCFRSGSRIEGVAEKPEKSHKDDKKAKKCNKKSDSGDSEDLPQINIRDQKNKFFQWWIIFIFVVIMIIITISINKQI